MSNGIVCFEGVSPNVAYNMIAGYCMIAMNDMTVSHLEISGDDAPAGNTGTHPEHHR